VLSHNGKVYGLPRDISTMVIYYNEDLFKAAGIPTPKELNDQGKWNWDTLLESAKKLTDTSKQQYGVSFSAWWGPAWGYFTKSCGQQNAPPVGRAGAGRGAGNQKRTAGQ